ncbi:iron chelate uptake ABC transporter family permease subunit [Desulfobulbus oligotrophicus]|uniref:Iron chelate uptake ABC transporter family permease subunit n=1 Tax=Desulfobulbus oligotrophicus TaxID=1909699 RepID=A0A7T5VDX9_9BACT|nr:iron chelate uptake ABC transporter family permease subunit [Desulfobulbus oligotrophicus]QQG66150.1 iron chelate uptake ABC transporter family permease subunit [Desulfobulbus oligotrophicus]
MPQASGKPCPCPLVSPGILGVLAGASFGAGLGIVLLSSWLATQILAFLFACLAVGLSCFLASFIRQSSLLVLILGGMVSTSFFTALTSLLKFPADPNRQLPELVYWLMGTFSRVETSSLYLISLPMPAGIFFICLHGKLINPLSMGDEEAASLGVDVRAVRLRLIIVATLISALSVVLVGRTAFSPWYQVREEDRLIAEQAMEKMRIQEHAQRPYSQLSGGQQQLVLLARALVQGARFFIMDEPVNSLDYGRQFHLLQTIRELADEGRSFLLTTHHPEHALFLEGRTLLMDKGKVLKDGFTKDIINQTSIENLYDLPAELMQKLARLRQQTGL